MRASRTPWGRVLVWTARLAVLGVIAAAIAGAGSSDIDAHGGHPQKKLFNGHWWHVDFGFNVDLTTSNFFYGLGVDFDGDTLVDNCDGGVGVSSCISKWSGPFQDSINDWNAQPMDVTFVQQGNQNPNNDIRIIVTDLIFGDPGYLGIGLLYDSNGTWCATLPGGYDSCGGSAYYFGDAWQGDDGHSGPYGTNDARRGTTLHELGHVINLKHESVPPDESQLYACGQDNTGAIPHSVMSYNCIDPPNVQTFPGQFGFGESYVHDWDTCGVNHKYYDPAIGFAECHYDEDNDGVNEPPDNCPGLANPTQSNFDADAFGDACDTDIDGDGILNGSDAEADGDKVTNVDETNCGSDPNDSRRRPERVDGVFAGVSDDGDAQVDEALPPGATNSDCDGDGFKGSVEASVFPGGGNGDRDSCGVTGQRSIATAMVSRGPWSQVYIPAEETVTGTHAATTAGPWTWSPAPSSSRTR